ncbi:hypothetical protein H2198_005168 [Neophaeococcomyces mojaviensis]|uniref:Uncharacterized protein n=1 Tax=Neophaeococcomyces mojaviensis TaxID=3383035 RepID=A0ACC3A6Y7_9EURO|nr:hypothetical protein H2198_005168 [Knufia sp. JES_112]
MRLPLWLSFLATITGVIQAATLQDVCTSSYIQASLPQNNIILGITIDHSSVQANAVTNISAGTSNDYPNVTITFCNVTFAYSHNGRNDRVQLRYYVPAPSNFKNRYLSTGGGGYAINSGARMLPGGVVNGAVAGITDGGFGAFTTNFNQVFLLANGAINYQPLYMFGYQGIQELTVIGKQFTKNLFNISNSNTKLYAYYQGCSEGGREGWSQVQRFGDELDGAITGAPAFRFSHQQVQHLWSNVVEQTLGYYPPSCELDKILNETLKACDPYDGKTDGVVARTDLCKLNFNLNSTIGMPYSCPAQPANSMIFPATPPYPAQNGTVTAQGVAVVREIIDGMHDLEGQRVYFSYQPSASLADAQTAYNTQTNKWELSISGLGGQFVGEYLYLLNETNLPTLANVTYDTLKEWVTLGWTRYEDSLQTTWPDLTPFNVAGGKVLHYHGESDNSIPTASSVRYWESVRQVMYPNMTYNASAAALKEWYKLFLVPGMAHCSPDPHQPNGLYPSNNLPTLINWVEQNVEPVTLNGTHTSGQMAGQTEQVCAWPLRPLYGGNGAAPQCVYDQKSIDTWHYDLNAFKVPVY